MKELVRHLLRNNLQEIVENSYLDCHVKGLHSLMLSMCPGKTIRAYFTTIDHELYKNHHKSKEPMSLSFHPHHCNLTLLGIKGRMTNYCAAPMPKAFEEWGVMKNIPLDKYKYTSQILEGQAKFELIDKVNLTITRTTIITNGRSITLPAKCIHTVFVPGGENAAWFVFEGKEDPDYIPYAYSNNDLTKATFDDYYKPLDEQSVREIAFELFHIKL